MTFIRTVYALLVTTVYFASHAAADKAMLVLDASGSMLGQIEGKAKMEIARDVVGDILAGWSPGTELGLIAYGHREKANCGDIQTVVPIGSVKPGEIKAAVAKLDPKGKTPISDSIRLAAKELKSEEGKATVILISDGLETCEADPCAVASELKKAGVDFKLHVIGFDTKEEENKQLRCMADNTGGKFIPAKNAGELKEAMTQTVALVSEPVAALPPEVIFQDGFDGSELSKAWDVRNEDKEAYVVENGSLLLLSSKNAGVINAPNVISPTDLKLDGDWDISAKIRPDFATGQDRFEIALVDGDKPSVLVRLKQEIAGGCGRLILDIQRFGSQPANDWRLIWGYGEGYGLCPSYGFLPPQQYQGFIKNLKDTGATLILSKRGRNYSAKLDVTEAKKAFTTGDLSIVRTAGRPAFAVGTTSAVTGQVSVLIDEVRIERR